MNILIFEDEIFNFHLLCHEPQELNKDYNVIVPSRRWRRGGSIFPPTTTPT